MEVEEVATKDKEVKGDVVEVEISEDTFNMEILLSISYWLVT